MTETKKCNKCKTEKPVTEFYKLKTYYKGECKKCSKEYEQKKRDEKNKYNFWY
jgi:hypothetical protein